MCGLLFARGVVAPLSAGNATSKVLKMIREPHFDDVRTIRSARRVVPLTAIRKRAKVRTFLNLGYALLISAALGAGVALVTSNVELRSALKEASIKNTATVSNNPEQPDTTAVNQTPAVDDSSVDVASSELTNETTSAETAKSQLPVARARKPSPLPTVLPDDDIETNSDELNSQPDSRWEERRARRVIRRELRRAARSQNNELFRIPEIFEGKQPQ